MIHWLVENALVAAALAGVFAVTFRRLRPRAALAHALWLVVLVKLVAPPLATWPWSVERGPRVAAVTPDRRPLTDWSVRDGSEALGAGNSPNENLTRVSGDAASRPGAPGGPGAMHHDGPAGSFEPLLDGPNAERESAQMSAGTAPPARPPISPPVRDGLLAVWLLGALWVLVSEARRARSLVAALREADDAPAELRAELAACAARLRTRVPRMKIVPGAESPFVFGLLRPTLCWPADLATTGGALRTVLTHELAHLHRRDHLVAWLELVVRVVHWWNPLVPFARARLREEAERAADAWVVSTWPADRRPYAEALLGFTERRSRELTPVLAMSGGAHRTLEKRLLAILEGSGRASLGRGATALAGVLLLASLPAWSASSAAAAEVPLEASSDEPSAARTVELEPSDERDAAAARVEQYVREALLPHVAGRPDARLGVAIVQGDVVVRRFAFGDFDFDGAQPIGTVGSALTGIVAGALRDAGHLELDDPLARHLADAPDDITLRHLLLHAGGLPSDVPGDTSSDCTSDPRARLECIAARRAPGLSREPSRLGFALLQEALQSAGNATFEELLATHVTRPFGLEDTRALPAATVAGLDGLESTLDDLARIVALHLRPIVSDAGGPHPVTLEELARPLLASDMGYASHALAWDLRWSSDRRPCLVRESRTGDHVALVTLCPHHKVGVVLLGHQVAQLGSLGSKALSAAIEELTLTAEVDRLFEEQRFDDLRASLATLCEAFPHDGRLLHLYAYVLLAVGENRAALAPLRRHYELGHRTEVAAYNLACAHAKLGEPDAAFPWLERALDLGFRDELLLRSDPDLASLRGDGRWGALRVADF